MVTWVFNKAKVTRDIGCNIALDFGYQSKYSKE